MKVQGFSYATVEAAIKKPGRKDFALIYSSVPTAAAAVFTTSSVKAAPVLVSQNNIKSRSARALVVNSGNANACTGEHGMTVAIDTCKTVAAALNIAINEVQICSTGVIGVQMPAEKVLNAIPSLISGLSSGTIDDVADAIMTTDTFAKKEFRCVNIGTSTVNIAGIAKGAGMIMPNMATMLSFIVTDAAVEQSFLEQTFVRAVNRSFNAITVDGDTSTNDTCLIMANGLAGNQIITDATPEAELFEKALGEVLLSLAKQIVKDGEGATKFIEIVVTGATSDDDAKKAAMAVANSSLVKTAFFGQDANWGRIFAAIGYSGAVIDQAKLSLYFDNVCMAEGGIFAGGNAEALGTEVLKQKEIKLSIDLGVGAGIATVYTSDLTHEYISINADYRS